MYNNILASNIFIPDCNVQIGVKIDYSQVDSM